MKHCLLQLILSEIELLVIKASPSIKININLVSTQLTPTKSSRNLGIMTDDQLIFKVHTALINHVNLPCKTLRRIRPYNTWYRLS